MNKQQATNREALRKDIADLGDKLEQAKKQEVALEAELRRWSAEVDNLRSGGPKAPPEVEAQRDQVKQLERESQMVGDELAKLEGSLPLHPRVTRHAEAFVPTEKEYGRPLKYAIAGGMLAFGFVVAGLSLLEAQGAASTPPTTSCRDWACRWSARCPWFPPRSVARRGGCR